MQSLQMTSADELLRLYDFFFIDAYGVLVDNSAAIPQASRFLQAIQDAGRDYLVVTNDAVRLPETAAALYARFGLSIAPERILTAGACLPELFAKQDLIGARCAIVGSADTQEYVRRAGGHPIAADPDFEADAVVVGSNAGIATSLIFDDLLSSIHRLIAKGRPPRLILPNTDVIYPRGSDRFGATAGAIAHLLEASLEILHPDLRPKFIRVGKPFRPIFDTALKRVPKGARVIMLGDQIPTDIRGARAAGLDSALVLTGLTRMPQAALELAPESQPTYILPSLALPA